VISQSGRLYDALYAEHDYEGESAWVVETVARYKRSAGNTLLDLACGTGRHMEYLQSRFTVEGLDIDREMLATAANRLPHVPMHEGDLTDFDLARQFDVVICMLSSIGYARWPETLGKTLGLIARHTRPGGVVLVEPWLPPEQPQAEVVSARVVERDGLKISRMRGLRTEDGASILSYDYLVTGPEGVEHFTERHELGIFSHEQYVTAFTKAGLETVHDPIGPSGLGAYIGVRPGGSRAV
jgi:trans-aconitate methyltransferase